MLFAAKILPIAPATAAAPTPATSTTPFARLALLFVLRVLAFVRRTRATIIRPLYLFDSLFTARLLFDGPRRRLHCRLRMFLVLLALEGTVAVAPAAAATAAAAAAAIFARLQLLAGVGRNFFLHRLAGGLNLFDHFRLNLCLGLGFVTIEEYVRCKQNILRFQRPGDFAIINAEEPDLVGAGPL